MTQLIDQPTRTTQVTKTTIDLIFISLPDQCGALPVLTSDHYLDTVYIIGKSQKRRSFY